MKYSPRKTAQKLAHNLTSILQYFSSAGFAVQTICLDLEFKKLRGLLTHTVINTNAAKETCDKIYYKIQMTSHSHHSQTSSSLSIMAKCLSSQIGYFQCLEPKRADLLS